MSGSGFRGRGFGPRGIRPGGPSGGRGGPRFPQPPFNRLPYPRHGSENWHEPPVQQFFPPWHYNGRVPFQKFPVRLPLRHDAAFHQGRGRGRNVRGMPPRMRMPGIPVPCRPEIQSENEMYISSSQNEQHKRSASLPHTSPAPPLGSEEERQQKIIEAADKLKQKLSSIKDQEVMNFWEDEQDPIPSSSKVPSNKEVAELHPQDFSLTFHDLKDIGRVDLHRTPMEDNSVVVLDEIYNRSIVEISLLDEEIRNCEGESECNVHNNEVKEETDNAQDNAIDKNITNIPTIDSTVVQSQENATLQIHQDNMSNFAAEIPPHNPPLRFNCRPEFHRGNINIPLRFIPRQMGPRFRMPYPQEMSSMGPRRPVLPRPKHPNCRPPPNQLDVPHLMFDPRTLPPAGFNRPRPPSNFQPMDQNLSINVPPQMQGNPMHSGARFNPREPPLCRGSPSNKERMNFTGFDPRKPPPSVVITQEEVLELPSVFDPRLSFQECQRLIPTVVSPQLHPPLSMQIPPSTLPPPPPPSGPPPPPAPPGPLLEMVPMTDFDMMSNYAMANNIDMAQTHFPQMDGVQSLPQQDAAEPDQNYMDMDGELFMEPPPEPPILSDYYSSPRSEAVPSIHAPPPPAEAPPLPAEAPPPPAEAPLPPTETPLPPKDAPVPPSNAPLPPTEVSLSSTKVLLPISEPPSVLLSNKQVPKTLCATETSKHQGLSSMSKEAILTSTSQPKTDMDKLKSKRFRMRKLKRENAATCLAPTVSMSHKDKMHTVQNQDISRQYQNTIQEEVPLSEEQSRPKVIFNLNAKIKKISKQEEWQQQADTSSARYRKLRAQMVASENPDSFRVKSHTQLRKTHSPKLSKSLTTSCKGSEVRGRVSEFSWKSTVIERFLKMSKNELGNILNNSSLRKFDIAMEQLVKERRSSLSWEMRNTEDEKIKSYDREQFICQLNQMLDPSATVDITNLPTEFIRHLGEVLQLNSLPQDQTNVVQNTEVEVNPVNTISKSKPAESTYYKLDNKAGCRSLVKEEIDVDTDLNEVHKNKTTNNVQVNVKQSRKPQRNVLNMDLDDIFLAGIAKAKHPSKSATPERAVTDFDVFVGPSEGEASHSPMITEPVPETEKFQEKTTFVESRINKCERWHRKARDDPDMFRNLTKEEWEAKYGKSINGDKVSNPSSSLDGNESSSNKEDISIDSSKSLSIKNVIDRNPRVRQSATLSVSKHVLNIAKSSSLHQEYPSTKGKSLSDSNSMAVAEVIESINPIEMSGTLWREKSSETCQTIARSARETKSREESNERRSTSETGREKSFLEIGSDRKYREGMSSSRKSRRRERKRKMKRDKDRRKRKRRQITRESSSSYSDSESDSMTLFTELIIKKEVVVKNEPELDKEVEGSVDKKTADPPELTECNNQSALQELNIDKTLVANKTIVTNQEPVTNKEIISSQELDTNKGSITRQECTSNKGTSLQMRKQTKPIILEMSKVPNKILVECFRKECANSKSIMTADNTTNSQVVDATGAISKSLESASKKSHLTKSEVEKERHSIFTSHSVTNKASDKSREEKDDNTSVTVLNKDTINIPLKTDKRSKDVVAKDAASVRSSSIEESSMTKKTGRETVNKVDIGNGTVRSKSSEGRPSMKFQNIKSEGRKEMKLIKEKVKKRSSSLLRDKKSGATKHSKMLTTELKSPKVKAHKEKTSSGTADSSEHRKPMIQINIPTEDNPEIKDPRLSKLKERAQHSPNTVSKDCHSKIFSEKSIVDSRTEESSKQQTQHSQSTLTSHGNVNKTLHDIEISIQTPLTVKACTVDSNTTIVESTSPEVISPRSLDSPFKGFSEESQLPSELLARSTLLRSQAELLNGTALSEIQETTSTKVLPEKSDEPESKDATNLLLIAASGDSNDIKKDEIIEVQVSSDSLNEKEKSDKLIVDKETHVKGLCVDTDTRGDENIQQEKVYENIVDTLKSAVEKLEDVDNLKEACVDKKTSELVEKLGTAETSVSLKALEQEVAKSLEVVEVLEVEKSSAVAKLPELAKISEVEKVTVAAKKYELVKIDTTAKDVVAKKEQQEVEKSAVAEEVQEASKVHQLTKTTEPLKVIDVVKSSTMGKSQGKIKSHGVTKIHEGIKSSATKKTQERTKIHEQTKPYDSEKLPVAEKTQDVTKSHGTKMLKTVKTPEVIKCCSMRKTRARSKVHEVAKMEEVKKSVIVEKTQELAKIHDAKKEHTQMPEVMKPSTVPKHHDVTGSLEAIKSSVELKTYESVKLSEVEKPLGVIKSPILLKRHEVVKSPDIQKAPEVAKLSTVLKKHEDLKSPEEEKITEVAKSPVVLKRHDFLKSHELKPLEVDKVSEVEKVSLVLKKHDAEKIQEIVKPSLLLKRIDGKSSSMEKMQDAVKPSVISKRHEVVKSPIVKKVQEVIKPSTTLKRHEAVTSPAIEKIQEEIKPFEVSKRYEAVKSPVVEKTQVVVKTSTTLKRHEVVKSPTDEKAQEVVKPSTSLKTHEEGKSSVSEKTQEEFKPSVASKRHEAVKSPVVEKTQVVVKTSTTLKRHEVVKSPIEEKAQEVVKPSTSLKIHEERKSPLIEQKEEAIKLSESLERYEVIKSPVTEKTQEVVKPSKTLKNHVKVESPEIEKTQEVVEKQEQIKTCEIIPINEVSKSLERAKVCEMSKMHESSASTSKSIHREAVKTQGEINPTTHPKESQDQLNSREKSQEKSSKAGFSNACVKKAQHVSPSESSNIEEKIMKRRRVLRWQDNNDIPRVIEPIQYIEKTKKKPRARKENKKCNSDPLRKIKNRPKFKDKIKIKAPTTLDKILSEKSTMSKQSVMSRMIDIDHEIHKLMTEKMMLYQLLESGSSLLDDNQANTMDNDASRSKKKKEVINEKLTASRLSSYDKLSSKKVHSLSHQNTHETRSRTILFDDDSQEDDESPEKDTSVHVFESLYEKRRTNTLLTTSEAEEGRSVDHVNIESDKLSLPSENNKSKKGLQLNKSDTAKTHNKSIISSEESANALTNSKTNSKPDMKTDNDIDIAREVSVESKSSTSPKYSKDKDDGTKVKENILEDQGVIRIIENRLQPSLIVDEESKSSENVSKRSDSKTMERVSIYSDDSTRESSLTPESSEPKKCATGLALLEETFRREKAISRKLKAEARKQKKEEIETLLKNVNSLTADEEEIPLNVLYEIKQKQKQHLLEEMGIKSKLEKLPQKSEENISIIWKHAMAVINAVAENITESATDETQQPEVPNLGKLVELSKTKPAFAEIETTVKPSDTGKIDKIDNLETVTSILKIVPEVPPSVEIPTANPTPKAAELHTLSESRHEELLHPENTSALMKNTEEDLISKNSKEESSHYQSDILSKNEVKDSSSQVAHDDMSDSLKNDNNEKTSNENKRLNNSEDERNIDEIGKTTEAERKNEDSSSVLNKKKEDNVECSETLMQPEDNSIKQKLTNNLDNTLINVELENQTTNSNVLDARQEETIVSPEKESSNEVDLTIKSKKHSHTLSELESLRKIDEAVKETMTDLVNSVPEFTSVETISRVNEDCSKKKDEERPVKYVEIDSQTEEKQTEEFNRSNGEDLFGSQAFNQTSFTPTEKNVQPSSLTSEENKSGVIKRSRRRPKNRARTNSSLSGTSSPVPSASTSCEKPIKSVPSRGKRKSNILEAKVARKRRKTRFSSRSSVELSGVSKETDPLETSVDAELPFSKGISVKESKKRKFISQFKLRDCKVRLVDCECTYLRPDYDPSILQQYGISRINAYGRIISVQRESSLKIKENERSASVSPVQEVIVPGDDITHAESDKEKDSSSFCSWDQNIPEIPESVDVSQDSMSQEEIIELRKNDNYGTIENREDTPDIEHVYLSHFDPTVLRQDEASSPRPVIDINEDESAANTSSQSDIEILEATKRSRSVNQVEDTEDENVQTAVVLEEEKLPRTEYTVHKGPVLDIKVYGDSFMAASEDGKVYRYSQVSNGILNIYRGHKSAVTCLCIPKINFSGISRHWLFSGSLDGTLRCYEIDSGQQVRESVNVGSPIQCMDHAWGVIFLGTKSGHVSRFHIKSGVMKGDNIQFSEVSVLALKATSEGPRRVLIVASRNQPITIRDAQNGLFLRTVSGHKNHTVYSLMMDHHMVYCGTSGTLIPVFDFITAEQVAQYNAGVGIVCMRLYKKLLFAGCYDGNIYVFNTKDRKLVCSIPGPGNMLLSMEVVDNKIIAGSKDRGLHIWLMPKTVRTLINKKSRNSRVQEI